METSEISLEKVKEKVSNFAYRLVMRKEKPTFDSIVAISRGGIVPGIFLRDFLTHYANLKGLELKVVDPFVEGALRQFVNKHVILVDDIYDSGATSKFFVAQAMKYKIKMLQFFVVDKRELSAEDKKLWWIFPWEIAQDEVGGRRQATVALLRSLDENPLRDGLRDTPKRVDRMWDELAAGYKQKPEEILKARFAAEEYDEMIVLSDIEFFSTCEHHMLPFYGKVHFGYLPGDSVVGISKIARLVDCFSRRLQIQERMTIEIGKTFERIIKPQGVGVIVEGIHLCMMLRGIKKRNAIMKTSYLSGPFRDLPEAREEFLRLIGK